ncbi:MAG: hypothetical protein ACI9XO_002933 [Paraglaciecola sp.]
MFTTLKNGPLKLFLAFLKRIIGILFVGSVAFPLVYGLIFNGFCMVCSRRFLSYQVLDQYGDTISQKMMYFRLIQAIYIDFYQFGFAISLLMTLPLFYKKEINNYF